ncbi:hydroxyethylthiazole kinase [Vibrio parahaemolyticus]|nr:hydroxyethylthiazole kinase [Vibrio parahaemolyticus]
MLIEQITQALTAVRQQKPLVVNITNYVVMNNTANALLAIGASPIMAHSKQEMAEMMSFAGALVINIGTLDSVWTPRMSYAVEQAQSKGVDALDSSDAALGAAHFLVKEYGASVVISGETDYIVTKEQTVQLNNGHEMMPYVTGMGCTLTALTGAFAAIGDETGLAAAAVLGVVGEIAAEQARGPGSLQMHLLDELYQLDEETLATRLKLQVR